MYRLKPEAVPFFAEKLRTSVYDFETWKKIYNVDENALEEVKPIYLTFGMPDREGSINKSTYGWSNDDGSHYHFTVHFPSAKYQEYDKFSKGETIRKMMDVIQKQLDYFYQQFIEESN